jgi:hypothetical protein
MRDIAKVLFLPGLLRTSPAIPKTKQAIVAMSPMMVKNCCEECVEEERKRG